jgi:hypothetical protein
MLPNCLLLYLLKIESKKIGKIFLNLENGAKIQNYNFTDSDLVHLFRDPSKVKIL